MKSRILLLVVSLVVSLNAFSQTGEYVKAPNPDEISLGAVNVELHRDRNTLIISYVVRLGADVRWCKIGLLQSTDGGHTFTRIPASKLSGDVDKIFESGTKEVRFNITDIKDQLEDKDIVFKVNVQSKDVVKREFLITGVASVYPNLSYGVMIGTVKKAGYYIKARSDFKSLSSSYNCTSNGELETGGEIWSNGLQSRSRFNITGGMLFHVNNWFYPYFGAGYGSKQLYMQDIQENWANVTDLSYKGVSFDAGILFRFGNFLVSTAVCNTAFKYTEAEMGIGFIF